MTLLSKKQTNEMFTLSQSPELLTYEQASKLLIIDPLFEEALDFYWGDHWRDGSAWIGPRLDDDDEDSIGVMDEIEASLVVHSGIEEVTDRKKDALLGRPGTWTVTVDRALKKDEHPNTKEQALIDEANAALVTWYDKKDVLDVLDDAQLDHLLGGRGMIRMIVPESELARLQDGTTVFPPGKKFEQCLKAIWPVHAPADQGVVLRDSFTMQLVGVFIYEVVDIVTGESVKLAEITFLDALGNTVVKTVGQQKLKNGKLKLINFGSDALLELGGRLTMYEFRSKKPLITEPILSNQKLLNMSLTMMGMNAVLGGFLERVILNGQKPGHWKEDVDGNRVFVAEPYKTGPKTTQWIAPMQVGVDPVTKAPIFGNPSIQWRDPVKVDTFVQTQSEAYRNILQGAHQLHVIMSGDAVASGESRKQARDDYEKSLKKDKAKLDRAGAWMLETALFWAAVLEGKPGRFEGLRVVYDTKVDAGPVAAIDRTAIREEVTALLRSRENAMVELRITDDPESEVALIATEQATTDPLQQIKARKDAAAILMQQASVINPNDKANPANPGGGTGGGGSGTGTSVRRGSGRSKPTIKK